MSCSIYSSDVLTKILKAVERKVYAFFFLYCDISVWYVVKGERKGEHLWQWGLRRRNLSTPQLASPPEILERKRVKTTATMTRPLCFCAGAAGCVTLRTLCHGLSALPYS